jgi:hypothetical protein
VEKKAVTVNEWFRQDSEQEQEWLRQDYLVYGGLIGVGVVMVQPFLTAASLDLSATICVVAFSVAIPLLAALAMVNGRKPSVVEGRRRALSPLRRRSLKRPPPSESSPASGTSCGSPGWDCW